MSKSLKFWLGFNLVKGIGPAKLTALVDYFGSVEAAWSAKIEELQKIGFDKRTIKSFVDTRATVDLDTKLAELERSDAQLVHWDSAEYPDTMRHVPNAPFAFYVRGHLLETDRFAVAIVGTRRITNYGRQLTREITQGLVKQGVTIVSGLARGIDSVAHQIAVDMGGRTIAVLGCGVDGVYPAENRQLAAKILDGHGAILSEYALGTQPERKNFPPRNRIISGLSLGTVVIEAGERSGAIITANFAQEQGREVYAVPGNVHNPSSRGTNELIKRGAKLITGAEDILEDLNLEYVPQQQALQLALPESAEEAALMPHLVGQPRHVDELSRIAGMPAGLVTSTLTMMELKGLVQQVGGMSYVLIREEPSTYDTN